MHAVCLLVCMHACECMWVGVHVRAHALSANACSASACKFVSAAILTQSRHAFTKYCEAAMDFDDWITDQTESTFVTPKKRKWITPMESASKALRPSSAASAAANRSPTSTLKKGRLSNAKRSGKWSVASWVAKVKLLPAADPDR